MKVIIWIGSVLAVGTIATILGINYFHLSCCETMLLVPAGIGSAIAYVTLGITLLPASP